MVDYLRKWDGRTRRGINRARIYKRTAQALETTLGREPTSNEIRESLSLTEHQHRKWTLSAQAICHYAFDEPSTSNDGKPWEEVLSDSSDSPADRIAREDMRCFLNTRITRLKERQRRVIELLYLEGISCSDLAARFGCTQSRILQIREEAFRKLRADPVLNRNL
jgi:RNA polymerase sigma factor (sigma-70 family)